METVSSSGSFRLPREPANYDEVSMHQSLLFSDSLKDLKNLRKQLYSAAEYFEFSFRNDDSKQIVVDTLKDYAIKALVNTVDHLGSVTYKVNDVLDDKVDEVSETEVKVSSIEQRVRICQAYMGREGLSQQSLVINTPKYHKHYILPVGKIMDGANQTKSMRGGCELDDQDDWHEFKNAVQTPIRETPPSAVRNGRSLSLSPRPSQQPGKFSLNSNLSKTEPEKQTVSPHRFPLLLSGSLPAQNSRSTTPISRSITPISSRPITPNSRRGFPAEPRKSTSMHLDRESHKGTDHNPSKSKRLLKAFLSRRKTQKDDTLYTYLDEY